MPSTFGPGFSYGASQPYPKPGHAQPAHASSQGVPYQAYSPYERPTAPRPSPGTAEYYSSQAFLDHVRGMGDAGASIRGLVGDYQRAKDAGLANPQWAQAIQQAGAGRANGWMDTRYVNDSMWQDASQGTKDYYMSANKPRDSQGNIVQRAPYTPAYDTPRSFSQWRKGPPGAWPFRQQPPYQA